MYGDHPGDPFRWRPFGCLYDRVGGRELRACLDAFNGSRVLLLGESTLEQASDLMRMHAGMGGSYWPVGINDATPRDTWPHPSLEGDSYHGVSTLLARGLERLRELTRDGGKPPAAYVLLQGANDAARDTLEAGAARVADFLTQLRDGIADGSIAKPLRGVIWATAPVRHYTAGAGPGQAECPAGADASNPKDLCVMAYPGDMVRSFEGCTAWTTHHGDQAVRTHGTLERRAAFNLHAVATFRSLFPEGHVVDFEVRHRSPCVLRCLARAVLPRCCADARCHRASITQALTAALPADYSYDGEHWVAVWDLWRHRNGRGVYEGKSMGGAELANVLANVLCPPL